jgi:DNA-binding transcriptional MerR regulator
MRRLTIGELARRAGVGVETVRFYQRRGLLAVPPRRGREYRVYSDAALATLRFIRRARGLGFTLREIGDLLELQRTGKNGWSAVRPILERKVQELDRRVHELSMARVTLEKLVKTLDESAPPEGDPLDAIFNIE